MMMMDAYMRDGGTVGVGWERQKRNSRESYTKEVSTHQNTQTPCAHTHTAHANIVNAIYLNASTTRTRELYAKDCV